MTMILQEDTVIRETEEIEVEVVAMEIDRSRSPQNHHSQLT